MTVKPAYEVPEVRAALGNISHQKVYNLFNSGELRSFKIGRRRLVSHEALIEYIRKREAEAANEHPLALPLGNTSKKSATRYGKEGNDFQVGRSDER